MKALRNLLQRSMGARLVALFLGLLFAVQVASFSALRASLSEHAHRALPARLDVGDRVFQSLLDQRAQKLIDGARLLAADYGFREALGSNDADTIVSALENHGNRIGATESALLSTDFRLRSSTTQHQVGLERLIAHLSDKAMTGGSASTIALLSGVPFQAVLVPIKAPVTVGWVMMAFPLDARLAGDMGSLSDLNVTLVFRPRADAAWKVGLSGLPASEARSLADGPWEGRLARMTPIDVGGEELGVRAKWLSAKDTSADDGAVVALLALSIDDAVRLPGDLQVALLGITLLGFIGFGFGSIFTARRVTQPLRSLSESAARLGAGDFETAVEGLNRQDEIGQLARSFERMRVDIAGKQEQVRRLAYWDPLTQLPNRLQFRESVQAAMSAHPDSTIAVIMLDLDRFRSVNDVLGYHFGDLLLAAVAERLKRSTVRPDDLVARLGADKFALLLTSGDSALGLAVAQRVEASFDAPLVLEGHTIDMRASIGIACWPQHAADLDMLLNRAELAMYGAKRRAQGAVVYEPAIDAPASWTLSLLSELRQAVERHELRLYLQPKLELKSGRLIGAESLLRWQHPERGLVPPIQFIPFAEQTGFIRELTLWVFEATAREWRLLHDQGLDLVLSVNLSTRDLLDVKLPQKLATILQRHRVPERAICLEITESAIMDEPQRALAILERLSQAGFALSIDDFGTGYSSLAYLKRLPVNELKIDQSFVRSMETDRSDAMIVRSTIDLAHNLGLSVVAEGIESAAVWDLLRDLNCDHAQGYHMSRPMPAAELGAWSELWAARPHATAPLPALHLH
ncbi:MAG: EAL domain-containing protein [Caldimonas sp.]